MTDVPPADGAVVLLAGPSGSGKSRLARASGLPVLCLDEFYKDGDDPSCPRDDELGIIDWDHPGAWNADAAMAAIEQVCQRGWAEVPVYDIRADRAVGTSTLRRDGHRVVVAEGIFVSEIIDRCAGAGLLADAIVITRSPATNIARRLARDLAERRKPPLTLLRRGWALMASERAQVETLVAAGCRPLDAAQAAAALARWARPAVADSA